MNPAFRRCKRISLSRAGSGQAGFTLLEVMIGLLLMTGMLLGFSYMALGSANLNRKTELLVTATNIIDGQMGAVISAAADNKSSGHGQAKGFVLYLRKLEEIVRLRPDYPIKVEYNAGRGILRYEFPVAAPGLVVGDMKTVTNLPVDKRHYMLGRGIMHVYLKESDVPEMFRSWDDCQQAVNPGDPDTWTGVTKTYFDMNSDGDGNDDFSNLLTIPEVGYPAVDLKMLPVSITVMYYPNIKYKNLSYAAGIADSGLPDPTYSIAAVTRSYVINDSSVLGLGLYSE